MLQRLSKSMPTSIKTKVAITTLLTVSIVLACVSWALFFYFHNLLRASIFRQQSVRVSETAEQLNGRIRLAGYHSLGDNQFLTSLSSEGLGSTGYLYILDGRTILSHPDSKRILETISEGKNRGIDQALKGMEGSLENVDSRQHLLSSFKKVREAGWILAANIPSEDAFAPLNRLAVTAALIAAAGIVLPIRSLTTCARRCAPCAASAKHCWKNLVKNWRERRATTLTRSSSAASIWAS